MVNRMISLSEDIFAKLRGEENASGLINNLLKVYYDTEQDPKDKLHELEHDINSKNKEVEQLKAKIEEIEKRKSLIIETGMQIVEKNEYQEKDKWERQIPILREAFKGWEIPKDKYDALFEEFIELLKAQKIKNIIEFMQNNNINKKEVKKR